MFNFINTLAFAIIGLIIATFIVNKSADKLGEKLEILGIKMGLPASVRGATLDGIASSFPEFATAMASVFFVSEMMSEGSSSFADIGVATIAGSGIFNVIMIPMLSILAYKGAKMTVDRKVVLRDMSFYFATIAILVGSFAIGTLNWITGALLISVYVLYVLYMVKETKEFKSDGGYDQNSSDVKEANKTSYWSIFIVSAVMIAIIYIAIELAVHSAVVVGYFLNIPTFVMSVIVLAAVTSIPDTVMSIRSASNGDAEGAIANAVGSNTFDIAIALGIPLLFVGTQAVSFGSNVGVFAFLIISALTTAWVLLTGITKQKTIAMGLVYMSFVVYVISLATGVI